MTKLSALLLGICAFSQAAGRLEPVAGIATDFTERPAVDTLLNWPTRVLSSGTDGFYLSEVFGRLLKVDGAGTLRVFGRAVPTGRLADTDEEGNYFYWNPPGISRISRTGQESLLYNFVNDRSLSALTGATTIAVSRNGFNIFLANRAGLWQLPGPRQLELPQAVSAQRIFHTNNGIAFIPPNRDRVYLDSTLLAGPSEPGKRIDGEPSLDGKTQILSDIAGDNAGKLYVADSNLGAIYRLYDGKVERFAGVEEGTQAEAGVPAREARFRFIESIAVDSLGRLLIVDSGALTVWRVEEDGRLSRAAGKARVEGGGPLDTALAHPTGLVYDQAGNLYIVDQLSFRIRVLTAEGNWEIAAGNGSTGPPADAGPALDSAVMPMGPIAVDREGWIYFIDAYSRVRRFQRNENLETWLTPTDLGGPAINLSSSGLGVTRDGELILSLGGELLRVTRQREVKPITRFPTNEYFFRPADLRRFTVFEDGSVVFVYPLNRSVVKVSLEGEIKLTSLAEVPDARVCLGIDTVNALAAKGNELLIAAGGSICRLSPDSVLSRLAGGIYTGTVIGDGEPPLSGPLGLITALAAAPDGSTVFAENDSNRVRRYVPASAK